MRKCVKGKRRQTKKNKQTGRQRDKQTETDREHTQYTRTHNEPVTFCRDRKLAYFMRTSGKLKIALINAKVEGNAVRGKFREGYAISTG